MVYFTFVATYLIFTYTVSGQFTTTSTNGNACNSSPCQNGGTCLDTQGGYACNCDVGYTGHDCNVDLDECASMPCENGGYCMNFMGNFICNCMTGYSGNTCQIAPSTISSPMTSASPANSTVSSAATSTVSSAPVKAQTLPVSTDCSSNPCQNRAVCLDTATGYTCRCAPGYMGNTCETEIDECASSPCLNVVKCIDQVNGFTCICKDGFNGTLCEKNIDDCAGVICQNGGTCLDLVNDYWCNCPVGYSGGHCETRLDIDDCYSNPCQHGGTCIDGHYSYTCQCDSHYKGTNCQTACHDVKADIVMLLDSSSSVGTSGFIKQLQFVASIANSFDIGPDKVNIGVVTFSTHPHLEFDLNTYHSKHSLINAIGHISYRHGQTYTDEAIDYLIRHSFTPKAGDRPDAPNIAVVITDGLSRHASSTSHEASLLHRHGVTTVAIGVGSRGDTGELYSIASSRDLVFTVANYDALHTIHSLLDHGICQAHQMYNTSTPSTTSNQYPTPTDIVTGNCEDKISYCSRYDQNVCHSYKQWASDNCAKSCHICTAQTEL